jgi:hypothetical protein
LLVGNGGAERHSVAAISFILLGQRRRRRRHHASRISFPSIRSIPGIFFIRPYFFYPSALFLSVRPFFIGSVPFLSVPSLFYPSLFYPLLSIVPKSVSREWVVWVERFEGTDKKAKDNKKRDVHPSARDSTDARLHPPW